MLLINAFSFIPKSHCLYTDYVFQFCEEAGRVQNVANATHQNGVPKQGSIFTAPVGKHKHGIFVVLHAERVIQKPKRANFIDAYTGGFLTCGRAIRHLNGYLKHHRQPSYRSPYIIVIGGYHFGRSYINDQKLYNWRTTDITRGISHIAKGRVAYVSTRKGHRSVCIERITYAKGRLAQQMAKKLSPVIAVYRHGPRKNRTVPLLSEKERKDDAHA